MLIRNYATECELKSLDTFFYLPCLTLNINFFQDEKSLVGWLQVRDSKTRARQYIPIVQPDPEGPFRKAPWHGNVNILKF